MKEVKQAGTIDENIAHHVLMTYPETANSFSTKCFHIDTLWSTKSSMLVHEESSKYEVHTNPMESTSCTLV